ncbi:endonuclease/exonuclease/phosphatase family protein [Sanyastnella coralliicola]|uniref:endonuclease/exonuclease/phosphatase family protein n=1 Tax=Sanyastnella coralliicola TaxID=3069118 RepID=UPI0027B94A5A|nr:endonuclease/exonuclease/phosphatase family protein [Longitalea sp. SCSIO 12813]
MQRLILLAVFICSFLACSDVRPTAINEDDSSISLMFYNVENLFDTVDDPDTYDEEFTPTGSKEWTEERYQHKLSQLGKVIASADSHMPDILGLCEVENATVVQDLIESAWFKKAGYDFLHVDSPDGRGIDVALIYNPDRIELSLASTIQSKLPVGDRPNTRLVMHAEGEFEGKALHVFVNHWPSRHGGQEHSEPNRLTVAYNVRQKIDEILEKDPEAQIVMMGDFNDHPNNKSLMEVLSAGKKGDRKLLVNLMWEKHKSGLGSYNYKGDWGALDQFIVSQNLVDGEGADVDESTVEFVKHDWMMYVNDKGEAYPSRTYGGKNYYAGFSDHLPIFMKINR